MQHVRVIYFLQNLHLLLLSRKPDQCPISSVLTQLLGVGVITRLPGPSEQSSNDCLLGGWPTDLSIGLDTYKSLSSVLVEKLNKIICFFWETTNWSACLRYINQPFTLKISTQSTKTFKYQRLAFIGKRYNEISMSTRSTDP